MSTDTLVDRPASTSVRLGSAQGVIEIQLAMGFDAIGLRGVHTARLYPWTEPDDGSAADTVLLDPRAGWEQSGLAEADAAEGPTLAAAQADPAHGTDGTADTDSADSAEWAALTAVPARLRPGAGGLVALLKAVVLITGLALAVALGRWNWPPPPPSQARPPAVAQAKPLVNAWASASVKPLANPLPTPLTNTAAKAAPPPAADTLEALR